MDKTYIEMSEKAGFSHPLTQDELQGMIGSYDECLDRLIEYFCMDVDRELEYYYQFASMNQLWLAFLMADKKDKWWSDGEWVPHKAGIGEGLF